ncbi:hypothetical protein JCM1393_25100 [Clostridium carnis]
MNRIDVLKNLEIELNTYKALIQLEKNDSYRKCLREKIDSLEFAIGEIKSSIPKVKIHEFLDSNKNWCIRVHVNDELVDSKNIEFISERKTAPEVPVQEQSKGE